MKKREILKHFFECFVFWRQGKIIWWKFFLCFSVALVLFLLLYYFIAFFFVSKEEICLENLKRSFEKEKICHETCALKRLENKKCLSFNLNKKTKIEKTMQSYIYNEELQIDFRIFLIDIFRSVYGSDNPPLSLVNYLSLQSANKSVQAAILRFFDFSRLSGDMNNPLDYYFSILEKESSSELRLEAAVKIATYKNAEQYFSVYQLSLIELIIMDKKTDKYLRQSLVLLLSDYLKAMPEETRALLEKIYQENFPGDNISRAFAADLLGVSLPEINQEEWDAYYKR